MKFKELSFYIEKIENTSSRLLITELLAELFKKLKSEEIEKTLYLLQGRVVPLFEKLEFSLAEKTIIKAVSMGLNVDRPFFEKTYKKIGDLGQTVEHFKKQIQLFDERDLSVLEVYRCFFELAKAAGGGSQEVKINILIGLIRQLDSLSSRYLVRIPMGVLRLGFSDMTVLDAFSWMIAGNKSLRTQIEQAYHVRPDLGFVGRTLKDQGIQGLRLVKPKVFTPIIMMRAERLSSGKEIIEKVGTCAVQQKFDGFRLQVHYSKKDNEVRLYSRNLEEVSHMYPDVIEGVKKEIRADEIIFEGEAIGYDPQTGSFLPFQETVQRKRKYNIEEKAKEIPLKFFAFELLFFNRVNYIHTSYKERRKILEKSIHEPKNTTENTILLAPEKILDTEKNIEIEFDDAISKGLEGIIAKKLNGIYQPGARGWNWIKFKRSYSSKIQDTIDCLVMGFDFGKGKRTDFGLGAFLVGVYDEKHDVFVTVAKIGTGLSDEEWKELGMKNKALRIKDKPNNYLIDKAMECDVWLIPKTVVEIRADEISRSPVHTAGRIMKSSKSGKGKEVDIPGFALRFPRLERFRDDKRSEEVTTLKELEKLFRGQKK
ncbi:ATP-dependent DNA ligase [Candidatus Roizmanbacteria bacterium]|nr:ATP-dependent DNA ligase [Candidatus Roizmanbacteria bacterium]